jgi:hypothetical protein
MTNIRRIVIIAVGIFALVIIASIIYLLTPRGYVMLQLAPKEASLTIDKQSRTSVTRGQKISMTPGEHTLVFSRDEFSTETLSVSVKNGETTTVTAALTPQTDAAWGIMRADKDSVAIFEGFNSRKTQQNITTFEAANPLYKKLPINTQEYYIYPCPSFLHPTNPLKKAICIDLTVETTREAALTALKNTGFDTSKEEMYISTDSKVRPIIHSDTFTIDYYHDLSNDKPTFVILINNQLSGSVAEQTAYLIKEKDSALAALEQAGYPLDNLNITYVNPELVKFNSSKDVTYPIIYH